jgi:hypothetical protein
MRILGKNFAIVFEPVNELTSSFLGHCDPSKCEIILQKGLTVDTANETLLHEVIHAVADLLGIAINEQQVTALSSGLYAVLSDNGIPFEYIKAPKN